ncbi:MAG: ABC transporter permease [Armatimonadota bacterium]|nr:ABC transporter permease [Armatimonadota bacterium]MDR7532046.1 ABC transporter permease [Armatimonadota bacterium]MDR7535977.1 ABC transporter permease [Armatimonadota bacterium]
MARALPYVLRGASIAAFLAAWEWAGRARITFAFPTFGATVRAGAELLRSGELPAALLVSGQGLLIGLAAAVAVGIPLGLVMGMVRPVGRVAGLYLELLIALPSAALIPLVILTFGINVRSAAAVVFVFSMPFVAMNAYGGVREVPPRLVEMARAFQATPVQLFRRVILPGSLPLILAGVRYGLSRAFIGLVIAELLLSPFGVGKVMMTAAAVFQYDRLFAAVAMIILLSVGTLGLLQRLERGLLRWRVG